MKNVVLLAPYFLPRRRVGSWRPFKFAIHLQQFGWQPHIITIQSASGTLTPKEKKLLKGIPIHPLTPLFDFTSQSGSQLSKSENDTETPKKNVLQPALDWIDKQFPADTWLPFFWLKYRKIAQVIDDIQPEVLWSTGDPWSGHWLTKRVAAQFDLPWIADFRDPWTLGEVSLKERSAFSSAMDKKIEAGVVRKASQLIFTSKTTEALYRHHYPGHAHKMHTIYNTFDEQLYSQPGKPKVRFDEKKLNLLFFGKFRRLSPAKSFIDILAELKTRDAEAAKDIQMYSFGPLNEADKRYAAKKNVLNSFTQLDPIPAEEMLSVLPNADILWLSTAREREHIIPAKLWDYLAVGRPIISTAPNPEIAEILSETGSGIQFSPDRTNALIDLLQKGVDAKQAGEELPMRFEPKKTAVQKFEATQATHSLAQLFDTLS